MHERLMASELFGVSVLSDTRSRTVTISLANHGTARRYTRSCAMPPRFTPRFAAVEDLPDTVLLEHPAARFTGRMVDQHPCCAPALFAGEVRVFPLDEHVPLMCFGGRYTSVAVPGSNEESM
jgi:hypothetical protein